MHGVGIKVAITINNPRARLLDVTRLCRRAGSHHTGVDRVEMAYLHKFLQDAVPCFGIMRSSFGYILLDRNGLEYLSKRLKDDAWDAPGGAAWLAFKATHRAKRIDTSLRRRALARAVPHQLLKMLKRNLPEDMTYFNVGHSNLTRRMLAAIKHLPSARTVVLVHDTIPLDYPEFQRSGTVDAFRAKLNNMVQYADALIYNSEQTKRDVARHADKRHAMPDGVVAHLGIDLDAPVHVQHSTNAKRISDPYFLTLGTIEPRKNHALLLDVWDALQKELGDACPKLIICGQRGWNNDAVFTRLDRLNDGSAVVEWNDVDDETLVPLMMNARGILFPSLAEGYGLPPIEAIALGKPVICGDLDIYREVLGEIPVYLNASDAYLWKKQIKNMLSSDSMIEADADPNRKRFAPPTWTAHFNAILGFLD